MMQPTTLKDLLRADAVDTGCEAAMAILDQYVELELAGQDAATQFPGTAAHLAACEACQGDRDSLRDFLRAQSWFGAPG